MKSFEGGEREELGEGWESKESRETNDARKAEMSRKCSSLESSSFTRRGGASVEPTKGHKRISAGVSLPESALMSKQNSSMNAN